MWAWLGPWVHGDISIGFDNHHHSAKQAFVLRAHQAHSRHDALWWWTCPLCKSQLDGLHRSLIGQSHRVKKMHLLLIHIPFVPMISGTSWYGHLLWYNGVTTRPRASLKHRRWNNFQYHCLPLNYHYAGAAWRTQVAFNFDQRCKCRNLQPFTLDQESSNCCYANKHFIVERWFVSK